MYAGTDLERVEEAVLARLIALEEQGQTPEEVD